MEAVKVSIDWSATLGRWATRYWTSAIVWSVGVVSLVIFYSWDANGTDSRFLHHLCLLIGLLFRAPPSSIGVAPAVWKLARSPTSCGVVSLFVCSFA